MNNTIVRNIGRFPQELDLVIGIPRSGLMAGAMAALALNLPLADLEGFLEGRILSTGRTRRRTNFERGVEGLNRILVIDDSTHTGSAMAEARERLERAYPDKTFFFCAVYGVGIKSSNVDLELEVVPQPRMFQWNVMHHDLLQLCCVDIDGVLCTDPTEAENDDGEAYINFILNAPPLYTPAQTIGYLVTSRLERYRPQTEAWLKSRGINYRELIMLDLPSKEERIRSNAHGTFKAKVYRRLDALFFIESDVHQAATIAQLSGKPVLCVGTQEVFYPDSLSPMAKIQYVRTFGARLRATSQTRTAKAKSLVRRVLGDEMYKRVKMIAKRA
jgi:uncharacterized HAD superfamily protein